MFFRQKQDDFDSKWDQKILRGPTDHIKALRNTSDQTP